MYSVFLYSLLSPCKCRFQRILCFEGLEGLGSKEPFPRGFVGFRGLEIQGLYPFGSVGIFTVRLGVQGLSFQRLRVHVFQVSGFQIFGLGCLASDFCGITGLWD